MESILNLPSSELMPAWTFKLMQWIMNLKDLFASPETKLDRFGIKQGEVVIDYGCGPGRYLKKASKMIGVDGTLYAVDIHDLAINCACKIKKKKNLENVKPIKADGYFVPIQENKADLIYALDMFHMISQPNELLNEFHRLIKPNGRLFLEDGHQKRSKTLEKVASNGRWRIENKNKEHLELKPKYK